MINRPRMLEDSPGRLRRDIYVALNISPATCLDPRLPGILERSCLCLDHIVLELTERLEVSEYGPLISAIAPLRHLGLRIAVDDAGSGFASMRHILHIRPGIINLDRSLITGIDDDQGQHALGAALAEFARQIGATLIAEGIETQAELTAVARIGMTAGQGYLIGRPSVHPGDWATWQELPGWIRSQGADPQPSCRSDETAIGAADFGAGSLFPAGDDAPVLPNPALPPASPTRDPARSPCLDVLPIHSRKAALCDIFGVETNELSTFTTSG
jgi:EAL domain-containing protein (putative c-di-GMP-specific phosphodiesterase class I)